MADDDSSDLSSLSSLSAPPTDDESDIQLERQHGILKFFHKVDKNPALEPKQAKEAEPPRPKREPSPPHEYVLADNPDIAFIVMFRARFTDVFPKSLANFGPQELENDVVQTVPGDRVEHFLCALLGLLLNRKQDVKPGHYNRALEEAIQTHKGQWAKDWEGQSPISGGATFASMTPVQRLTLLRTLVQWCLSSSDAVKTMINQQYKNRHDEDLNISLSVQPWGSDGDKRRYYLIEGNDDTHFRVYRESNPAGVSRTWWSVAGTIDELKSLSEKLETTDGGPKARALSKRILASIPRFEATEEKRRRREYRQMRKEQFKRPEPGYSLYEGRTRGKRMKYTYSDDEGDFFDSDSTQNRRSTRNTRNHTPAEPSGPVTTASGRQIRAPTRLNVETTSNGVPSAAASAQGDGDVEMSMNGEETARQGEEAEQPVTVGRTGRPRRSAAVHHGTNGWSNSNEKSKKKRKGEDDDSDMSDDEEGSEPDFGDDEEDEHVPDETEEDEDDFVEAEDETMGDDETDTVAGGSADKNSDSLVVKFPIRVSFDENAKVKQVPGPSGALGRGGGSAEKHKRPRAAHRSVVVSDESESGTGSGSRFEKSGQTTEYDDEEEEGEDSNTEKRKLFVPRPEEVVQEEGPAAESISVVPLVKKAAVTPIADASEPVAANQATETAPAAAAEVAPEAPSTITTGGDGGGTPVKPQQPTTLAQSPLAFRGSPEKPQQQQQQHVSASC